MIEVACLINQIHFKRIKIIINKLCTILNHKALMKTQFPDLRYKKILNSVLNLKDFKLKNLTFL